MPAWSNRGKNSTSYSTREESIVEHNTRESVSVEYTERVTGGANYSTYSPSSASYSTHQPSSSGYSDRSKTDGIWTEYGKNIMYYIHWTTSTRPSSPFSGQTGHNDDFNGLETYLNGNWIILMGYWTVATRPNTSTIGAGSKGWNSDTGYGLETWDGTNWRLL